MLLLTSSAITGHGSSQFLLPLAHVASVITSSRKHLSRRTGRSPEAALNQESFDKACQSVTSLIENGFLNSDHINYVLKVKKNAPLKSALKSPWIASHSSGWSFNENKYSKGPYANAYLYLCKNIYLQEVVPKRTFKTRRSTVTREAEDAPAYRKAESAAGDAGFSILRNQKLKARKEEEGNEKLKSLLEETKSKDEEQRLKVAFAEGYTAASPKGKISTKLKVFNIFRDVIGIFILIIVLFAMAGEMSGGPFRRVLIGSGSEVHPEEIDVTFDDVKGVEEAKQELREVVDFLQNPEKFSKLGGKLPKGVLLVGPAGTGKTLLARAVAGEAGVPFFHAAGPEFDEILVGQGARRVRDLFSTAKLKAPCVIFIDEIDSVGAKRTNSVLHPYANQTINQLLTEMDGFRQNEGIVVLGATNRRDDLDKALLRPGRFDVEVQVPVPDLNGRKEIFHLYLSKVKVARDVDPEVLAKRTTGFTGADIESMVNQAAIRAAIDGAKEVGMKHLENARDKVIMGPERKSRIPDQEDNKITAYHESGHALVSYYTKDATPIHKVTIVSRGSSLGHTAYIPEKESYHVTRSQMEAMLDAALGGRAAEELVFGPSKVTAGAANDLQRATEIAVSMVKHLGMSEKVGLRTFDEQKNSLFVVNDLSQNTVDQIDSEIKRILQDSFERAKNILRTHSKELRIIAEALLKYETLDVEDIRAVLEGRTPKIADVKKHK